MERPLRRPNKEKSEGQIAYEFFAQRDTTSRSWPEWRLLAPTDQAHYSMLAERMMAEYERRQAEKAAE